MKVKGLLLAVDCTGETFSLALWDGMLLGEKSGGQPRRHLVELFPALQHLCAEAGRRLDEVRGVSVTAGPGSFTGVRTGLLIAKTLGQALDIPVVALDTLDVIASNAPDKSSLVAAMDARKGEVIWGVYSHARPVQPRRLAAPAEWMQEIPPGATVLGSACKTYADLLSQRADVQVADETFWQPRAAVMASMAAGSAAGLRWDKLRPDYVRPADVQVHKT